MLFNLLPTRGRSEFIPRLLLSDNRQNRQGYAAVFGYSRQEGPDTAWGTLTVYRA